MWGSPHPPQSGGLFGAQGQECLPSLNSLQSRRDTASLLVISSDLTTEVCEVHAGLQPGDQGVDIRVVEFQALQQGNGPILASSL